MGMSRFYDLIDQVPEPDRHLVATEAQRQVNMCGGRPSDAAWDALQDYKRDPEKFRINFKKSRENSYYS